MKLTVEFEQQIVSGCRCLSCWEDDTETILVRKTDEEPFTEEEFKRIKEKLGELV